MPARDMPLTLEQGATADNTVIPEISLSNADGSPFNFAGWTMETPIKDKKGGTTIASFAADTSTPGVLALSLDAASAALLPESGCVYRATMVKGSERHHIVTGKITVTKEV